MLLHMNITATKVSINVQTQVLLLRLRFRCSWAPWHIKQQPVATSTGPLWHRQPPPVWSRLFAELFCTTSSLSVPFLMCHILESTSLLLWPASDLVSYIMWPDALSQSLLVFSVYDLLICYIWSLYDTCSIFFRQHWYNTLHFCAVLAIILYISWA